MLYGKTTEALDRLSAEQFYVTQINGTEPPFTGVYDDHFAPGIYVDVVSGEPLFSSKAKFSSGSGWPAFSEALVEENIVLYLDAHQGMIRIEVRSAHGDSHLGHVFTDGPKDLGGLRYCINSAALRFIAKAEMEAEGYGAYLEHLEDQS